MDFDNIFRRKLNDYSGTYEDSDKRHKEEVDNWYLYKKGNGFTIDTITRIKKILETIPQCKEIAEKDNKSFCNLESEIIRVHYPDDSVVEEKYDVLGRFGQGKIQLSNELKSMPSEKQIMTFLHELFHEVMDVENPELKYDIHAYCYYKEEALANACMLKAIEQSGDSKLFNSVLSEVREQPKGYNLGAVLYKSIDIIATIDSWKEEKSSGTSKERQEEWLNANIPSH